MGLTAKILVAFAMVVNLAACSAPDIFVQEAEYFDQQVKGHPGLTFSTQQAQSPGQDDERFSLNYVSTGAVDKPAIVFIHGTPGDWSTASRYLMDSQLQQQALVVAIDRPGWGESQLVNKKAEPSFTAQARLIKPLLQRIRKQNNQAGVILVGHSLGASLAPRIAMDYPDLVDGLVLISGSLDPTLGKPRWYNRAATMGVVSWFLGPGMRKANKEIMPLHNQLQQMVPLWSEVSIPVTLIQGMEDELVHPKNADFAERVLVNADLQIIRLKEAGHFVPWENRETVKTAIIGMLNKLEN